MALLRMNIVRGTLQCKWVTTINFYIYYMFWLFLGVFFPLIPNPLGDRSYLLSILRKSKMAAINNHFLGNVLKTPLIIRNRCIWCLFFGFRGQRIQRIGFRFSISGIMSKSKMAAIKSLFLKNILRSFRIDTNQRFWWLFLGLGVLWVRWTKFRWSILSKMTKSKMAAINIVFFENVQKTL